MESKAISASISAEKNSGFSYFVRILSSSSIDGYVSVDKDTWYSFGDLSSVTIAQGKWTFEAVAVETSRVSSLDESEYEGAAAMKGTVEVYVNLSTRTISIPLRECTEGAGVVNLNYTVVDGDGVSGDQCEYHLDSSVVEVYDGEDWATTDIHLSFGDNANIPVGRYLLHVIIRDQSNVEVFHDTVGFPVLNCSTTNITGKYQEKKPATVITDQTKPDGEPGGLKEALEWAHDYNEPEVVVTIGNNIPVDTGAVEEGKPVFEIPACVGNVDIDMAGNDFTVANNSSTDKTTLFHVDSGKTLTFGNRLAANDQANVVSGNKGAAISMDGGTLNLTGVSIRQSNGNSGLGNINFVGCLGSESSNSGGTINLVSKAFLENAAYGISNLVPQSGTKPKSTINGNVTINVSGGSSIKGSGYGIYLANINGDVTITVDGGSISSQYPISISGMQAGKTLRIVLKNGGTISSTLNKSLVLCSQTNINKIIEYDSSCTTTANNAAFKGWTKIQL